MTNAIIALNPMQMQEAQATTLQWVDLRIADADSDLEGAQTMLAALKGAGLNTAPATKMIQKAKRRRMFYDKVKAALAAGYYIIPPFNVQLFAIRTDRASPNQTSTSAWPKEQEARTLPLGKGDYVSPVVGRHKAGTTTEKGYDGKECEVTLWTNDNWRDHLDMPARALKPQLIEATGQALSLKIFDALGIAPAYRSADPIIAGQINRWDGKGALTFFVAWWLDQSDL